MFRRLRALSTPFYKANVLHVDFSVETIPANRKTQSFKLRRKLCCFVPDWGTTAYKLFPLHPTRLTYCMSITVSKQSLHIGKLNLSNFDENSVISFLIEILRHLNAPSTPFYTPNVVHADFRVETIPANRKTQSFKFRLRLCYFVPDWDDSTFKGSFPAILHAECSACRFQGRNKPCKSQYAIFQISSKTLLFRSWLRCFDVWWLFPLHSTRRMYCMSISASKQSLQIAKRNHSNFYEISVISFRIEILRHWHDLFTPFYTPNVVHVDFSVETIPANRKTQSFKFRRKLCCFVPDWDVSTFNGSFHSILHAERIACRFRCRNNPSKSQYAIFQISTKTL
jgi:putative component of membrane protein insertase Oxa1/YidC/SpoIIIJ protein YidD